MSKQAWLTSCTPVKTARPDPRRGSRAIAIPPPTTGICGRYQLPVGGIREQYAHPSFLSIEIGVKLRRSPGHRSWSLSSRTAGSSGRALLFPRVPKPKLMMDSGSVSVRVCIPCSPMRVTGVKRMLPARGKFLLLEPGNTVVVLPVRHQEPCAPIEQGQRFCRKIPHLPHLLGHLK